MSIQVQHRRDTTTNVEANTPAAGELWWDTSKNEMGMGNGAIAGGIRMQKKNIREIVSPAQITANTNDYSPTNLKHAGTLRLTTDISRNLTGLVPLTVTDSTDGRVITLYNAGAANLVVQNNNASSSAANRFDLGGADITLAPKQSITLRYSNTIALWEIVEGTYGQAISDGSVSARKLATSSLGAFSGMINGTIVESHAANAATFAIKTLAGADPSATDPVYFVFRDVTPGAGDFVVRTVTAALNFTLSAGSAIGFSNGVVGKFWLCAIDNAGTVLLGAINCLSGISIFPLAGFGIITTVAEGGAGAADSAQVMYAASAVTSKAYAILGYASYETAPATAGNWAASPDRLQLYGPGVPLPGQSIQAPRNDSGTLATGTTIIPVDNTIPQNTEGDQYLSQAITPSHATHLLRAKVQGVFGDASSSGQFLAMSLFRDSVANALAATASISGGASGTGYPIELTLEKKVLAASAVSTTFKMRAGVGTTGTVSFNGVNGVQLFGGVTNSYIEVEEIAT